MDGLIKFVVESEKKQSRNLGFEIYMEGKGKVAHGLVWYDLSSGSGSSNSSALNTTILHPALNLGSNQPFTPVAISKRIPVPVPRTSIALSFNFFGEAIPPAEFDAAFGAANVEILDHIIRGRQLQIPHDRYEYDDSDAHIAVIGNGGVGITWLQVFQILQTMHGFVTRSPPHCQMLQYEIYFGPELVGFGLLWYDSPKMAAES